MHHPSCALLILFWSKFFAFRIPRPAFRVFAVRATLRQPVDLADNLRRQFDAPLTNLLAFMINPALSADNVEVTAGHPGGLQSPASVDGFFKTAEPAALADLFPAGHQFGSETVIRCWMRWTRVGPAPSITCQKS